MNNILKLITCSFITISFIGCAPKLTYTEIYNLTNAQYVAFNENNIQYDYDNTLSKYIKEYGEEGYRKKLEKINESRINNEHKPIYNDIGDLKIQDLNKCKSTYFYKVKFIVDKAQMTPYLDSIALQNNYKIFGKNNVHFDSKTKILETRLRNEQVLILDRDKKWKVISLKSFEKDFYDRYYGKGFSKCVIGKSENSEYLLYW